MSDKLDPSVNRAWMRMLDDELEPGDGEILAEALEAGSLSPQEFADLLAMDQLLRVEAEESIAGESPFVLAHEVRQLEGGDDAFLKRVESSVSEPKRFSRWLPYLIGVVAALVVLAFVLRMPSPSATEQVGVAGGGPTLEQGGKIQYAQLERRPGQFVDFGDATALVTHSHQIVLEPEAGSELSDGVYFLSRGAFEFQYRSGTRIVASAPCRFEVDGFSRIRLKEGRLRVRVPLNAVGFQVETPTVVITDLSTEFGVFVREDGGVFVETFDGLVEVSGGGLADPVALAAPRSQWFGVDGIDQESPSFTDVQTIQTNNYADRRNRILEIYDCAAFYDFQPGVNDTVLMDQANARNGAIQGATWVQGRWPGKSALQFEREGDLVEMGIPGSLENFTIATWIKVDRFDSEYGVILNAKGWSPGALHYQVMETGAVNLGRGPTEALKREKKKPVDPWIYWNAPAYTVALGEWQHLATVADAEKKTVSHYRNGVLVGEVGAPGLHRSHFGRCSIGQWLQPIEENGPRPFRGRMDELIVIRQALSSQQIKKLVQP